MLDKIAATSPKTSRRMRASAARIEEIIALAQRRGMTSTRISELPDGTTEIHFGGGQVVKEPLSGYWDDL
ncbi:hypothetical protein [Vannielia sp. SX4]|uniref:hypothetical protein n=1 Tax=Vannielia sp. SX4 TaxID=3463852 RepID=UPI00405907C4